MKRKLKKKARHGAKMVYDLGGKRGLESAKEHLHRVKGGKKAAKTKHRKKVRKIRRSVSKLGYFPGLRLGY